MEHLQGKKIYVGLSGGVDSSVTAALLKRAGADVVGVFIKGWYPPSLSCTWAEDRRDAMRIAARLQIPFATLDASKEYKQSVIDYLIAEYAAGRTPNPDIMCNRDVKFGAFYAFAKEHGADFIATGHYARLMQENGQARLLRGKDAAKDQSYFLWSVAKDTLKDTLFPLGELEKANVRKLARQFSLPTAAKKDSQGICFLGSVSMDDFLRAEVGAEPGKAVDATGKEIGEHEGAVLYTIGERAGLNSALPGPWYVLSKDLGSNVIVVSKERSAPAASSGVRFSSPNWIQKPAEGELLSAQYRYHGPCVEGKVEGDIFTPSSAFPEELAPGQSLVFYQGEECLGGGIISG